MKTLISFDKSELFLKSLLIILLFANTMLYSTNTLMIYTVLSVTVFSIIWIYIILKKIKINVFLKTKFFIWMTIILILYEGYGFLRQDYGNFDWDHVLFIYLSTVHVCMLLSLVKKENLLKDFIDVSCTTSILMIIYIVVNEYSNIMSGGFRIGTSGSGNVITIATYLNMFSIPTLYAFMFKNRKKMIIPYILQVVFMLLTGTKKVIFLVILTIIMFSVYKYKANLLRYIKIILIMLIFFVVIMQIPYFYNIIGARFIDFLAEIGIDVGTKTIASNSTILREKMYAVTPELFLRNPFFGGGWGYFAKFSGLGLYSHCNYIEILITFGLFGFFIYYIYFINTIILYLRKLKILESIFFINMLVNILISDFTTITFYIIIINYVVLFFANQYYQLFLKNNKEG